MPLINVSNTTDPQNSVIPSTDFQSVPINQASVNNLAVDKADLQVKEYMSPEIANEVVEVDIKDKFNSKVENVIPSLGNDLELPPLSSPEDISRIQSTLSQALNTNKPLDVSPLNNKNTIVQQSVSSDETSVPHLQVKDLVKEMSQINANNNMTSDLSTNETPTQENPDWGNVNLTNLSEILDIAIKRNASDIHLTPYYRPTIRVDGKLEVASSVILNTEIIDGYVKVLLEGRPEVDITKIKEFDLTYTSKSRRFRVNIFKQMGNFSITLRIIPDKILSIADLGLPDIVSEFPNFPNGLVLVTGPTGSGKSTTIAAILNQINLTLPKHIVTLEDPIEFVFPKGIGLVDQREFGIDFTSWDNALRSVLRQDPDVVLVGEMRDLETVEAALQIAETGHLVFATLHTNGAAETINRVVDIFDSQKQDQIRVQLSSVLRAVISQKLVPVSTGGRKVVIEVLLSTPSVKNAIRDKKTFQISNIIQTSSELGMISMEKSLVKMVKDGLISKDTAKSLSVNPNEIDILLQ